MNRIKDLKGILGKSVLTMLDSATQGIQAKFGDAVTRAFGPPARPTLHSFIDRSSPPADTPTAETILLTRIKTPSQPQFMPDDVQDGDRITLPSPGIGEEHDYSRDSVRVSTTDGGAVLIESARPPSSRRHKPPSAP